MRNQPNQNEPKGSQMSAEIFAFEGFGQVLVINIIMT